MQRNRPKNDAVKQNPAGENTAAPTPLPKEDHRTMGRSAPSKGNPKPIPSTMGYVGRRIR